MSLLLLCASFQYWKIKRDKNWIYLVFLLTMTFISSKTDNIETSRITHCDGNMKKCLITILTCFSTANDRIAEFFLVEFVPLERHLSIWMYEELTQLWFGHLHVEMIQCYNEEILFTSEYYELVQLLQRLFLDDIIVQMICICSSLIMKR